MAIGAPSPSSSDRAHPPKIVVEGLIDLPWRVLGPLGFSAFGRVCLWLAPFVLLETFRGNRAFFVSAYGGSPKRESRTASWWLLFAAAVDGEAQGSSRQVDQLLEMLDPATARRLPLC